MLTKKQEQLLAKVQKPARYTGGEVNSVVKDKNHVKLRYACLHRGRIWKT